MKWSLTAFTSTSTLEMAAQKLSDRCGREPIAHTVVLHLVDQELQVHAGIPTALTSTLGLAMTAQKPKWQMRPKPLMPMVVGMAIDAHGAAVARSAAAF